MSDETGCKHGPTTESGPDYQAFISALMNGPALAGDVETGARFIVHALRGFGVRQHFDQHHPDHIERGLEMAPSEGSDREAWLYGYWFAEKAREGA